MNIQTGLVIICHWLVFFTVIMLGCQSRNEGEESLDQGIRDGTVSPSEDDSLRPLPPDWVDILTLDSSIDIDIKYATTDNFVTEQLYPCPRCILRSEVAQAIRKVHQTLRAKGLGLRIFDCYRPLSVQHKLWDKLPDPRFVTDPKKGSMHNRGAAVDLTILNMETGMPLNMGTAFDHFGIEAYHDNQSLEREVLANRELLKEHMHQVGFRHIRTEWWHYSYVPRTYNLADYTWDCPPEQVL